jgi:molybdate/tungstate transport system ATP-binding protein
LPSRKPLDYRELRQKLPANSQLASRGAPHLIRIENLHVQAGTFSLKSLSFEIATGQYGVLMGRTGSGKTTLIEAICGLRKVVGGRIWLGDRDVTALKPAERGIGFVPQDGALFGTMSVSQQLGFALTVRRWKQPQIDRRVGELAELLGITGLLPRLPAGLSGGERQRVALGRALAASPGVLCLDEPLSALDDATREEMYGLLAKVREFAGVTTLHITHNRQEATRLADVVLLLEEGQIRALAPQELSQDLSVRPAPNAARPGDG